jgi:thiol-disulfide isomerase/thioredoxin
MRTVHGVLGIVMVLFATGGGGAEKALISSLGKTVTGVVLQDIYYDEVALDALPPGKAHVLYFFSNTCPIARRYTPRMEQLHQQYSTQGIRFIAVNASPADTLVDVAQYALDYNVTFPVFNDPESKGVRQFGISRTPEVVVLDEARMVRYQGRVDDQYRLGGVRPKVGRHDLRVAIDELLGDRLVTVPRTRSEGCSITLPMLPTPDGALTYQRDVKPALVTHCVSCHTGPRAKPRLDSYAAVFEQKEALRRVILQEQMPPWYACMENDPPIDTRGRVPLRTRYRIANWTLGAGLEGESALTEVELPKTDVAGRSVLFSIQDAEKIAVNAKQGKATFRLESSASVQPRWVASIALNGAGFRYGLLYIPEPEGGEGETRHLAGPVLANAMYKAPPGAAIEVPGGATLLLDLYYAPGERLSATEVELEIGLLDKIPGEIVTCMAVPLRPGNADSVKIPPRKRVVGLAPVLFSRAAVEISQEQVGDDGRILAIPAYDPRWPLTYYLNADSQPQFRSGSLIIQTRERTGAVVSTQSQEDSEGATGTLFIQLLAQGRT